ILLVILAFFACCCRSTQLEDKALIEQSSNVTINKNDKVFALYKNEEFKNAEVSDKYIFFRLYQPHYDNPFCPENFLKNAIGTVDVAPESISHSAIAFDLNDSFYGLTTAGKKDLKIESCTDTKSNPYMKKCNKFKSVQTTYAIKVTDKEYEKAKQLVEQYFEDPKTKYTVSQNFLIAGYGIKRKMFFRNNEKKLGGKPHKHPDDTFEEDKYDFVCSTFIAYVLANSVESVKQYFIENQIDANYVMPSDLEDLPGALKLFKSTWVDYTIAAKAYSTYYTCLSPFFKEYLVKHDDEN
ncbi:MAG: hypothetical protein KBS84_07935, partial [Treponema sp.]|nr:hypothetical protein [Candidatus Treponema scatequi]